MKRVIIGPAVLYLADCRKVLPEIRAESVPMIFTDPPYGHNNNNNGDLIHRWEAALGRSKPGKSRPIKGDDAEQSSKLVKHLFNEAARVLRRGSCCCCCGGGGGPDPQFARWSLWMDEVLFFDQMVIWDKGPIGMGWRYRRSYETVLVGHRRGGKMRWFDRSHRVENIIRPGSGIKKIIPQKHDHPTLKPIELPAHFIRLHTSRGDMVLDPFMGSGTTGVAAIELGRKFIGIEKDPKYFAIAVKRIRDAWKEKQAA
jgi:DNA modification methylase